MLLHELVEASNAVARTSGRREKTSLLADVLKRMADRDIEIGVAYLSGSLVQGRIGIGWAALGQPRAAGAADSAVLELSEVDQSFDKIARTSGAGAARERAHLLADLFARATRDEQDFLTRLLSGDLRQVHSRAF